MNKQLLAEVIKWDEEKCECWVEIADGLRIRTIISSPSLCKLNLKSGEEFIWDTDIKIAQRVTPVDNRDIQAELEALDRDYFNNLKTEFL